MEVIRGGIVDCESILNLRDERAGRLLRRQGAAESSLGRTPRGPACMLSRPEGEALESPLLRGGITLSIGPIPRPSGLGYYRAPLRGENTTTRTLLSSTPAPHPRGPPRRPRSRTPRWC